MSIFKDKISNTIDACLSKIPFDSTSEKLPLGSPETVAEVSHCSTSGITERAANLETDARLMHSKFLSATTKRSLSPAYEWVGERARVDLASKRGYFDRRPAAAAAFSTLTSPESGAQKKR